MSKAQRVREHNARQKIAAQQAAARRAETRRRLLIAGGSVLAVIAIVVALVVVKLGQAPARAGAAVAKPAIAAEITTLPAATFDSVGKGLAANLTATKGQPVLRQGGKPELLYMGGEYCPYCAAERWAMAAALSRFGTFSGLHFIHSAPDDGHIATLTFYHSTYTSRYLAFVPVEWYGEASSGTTPTGHVVLQQPTSQQAALFRKYDSPPFVSAQAQGGFPFVDIANQYLSPGAQYQPASLSGLTWQQIAAAMAHPSGSRRVVGQEIDGAANTITAAICKVTGGKPGGVCAAPGVRAASAGL